MIKPPRLRPGDTVALVSPSKTLDGRTTEVEKARRNFENATGLKTVLAPNALAKHYYSAGTPEQRLDDLHWAVTNPEIAAIIFTVGGNTAIDLLTGMNFSLLKEHPKIISGISDATTLLDAITAKTSLITYLGTEFLDFAHYDMPYEAASMRQVWFDGQPYGITPNSHWRNFDGLPTTYTGWRCIRAGVAEGKIVGGNGTCFVQLLGTEYEMDARGNILFLEYYKRAKGEIHRQLMQLRLRGVFEGVAGLAMGYCLGSDDPTQVGDERSLKDLVLEVTAGYNFPVMWIGEVGHKVENVMLPLGIRAMIDSIQRQLAILEPTVA